MRTWLYDLLTTDPALQDKLGGVEEIKHRVIPRQSETNVSIPRPYLVYGLGNSTNEGLEDSTADDARAERQFFQIWIHDEGGTYSDIDDIIPLVKRRLVGASHPPSQVASIIYLETSAEFSNDTYNTIFRYIRFQAILAQGGATT